MPYNPREIENRMDALLLYGGQRECYPHRSAFWYLKEDLLQVVQALLGL